MISQTLFEDALVPGCLIQIDMIGVIYTKDDGDDDLDDDWDDDWDNDEV